MNSGTFWRQKFRGFSDIHFPKFGSDEKAELRRKTLVLGELPDRFLEFRFRAVRARAALVPVVCSGRTPSIEARVQSTFSPKSEPAGARSGDSSAAQMVPSIVEPFVSPLVNSDLTRSPVSVLKVGRCW